MSFSNKAKLLISFLAVIIATVVVNQYLQNKPNAYEVYMNGKHLAFIQNKEEFYNVKKDIELDLEKRFGKVMMNDNIQFNYVKVSPDKLNSTKNIREGIIRNSSDKVSAVLMKSDGKELGFLANENEIRKVLDAVKDIYIKKYANSGLKLKNHITYVEEDISISNIKTIEDIVKVATVDEKEALVSFIKENEISKSLSLSRSASLYSYMYTPSRGEITSPFGSRWGKMHNGVDIGASMGDPIYAAMDGKVCCTEWEDGYGNVIKIDHGSGVETIYAHCSSIGVSLGEYVKRGEQIGKVGSTGRSTGPHVHFEVRINNVPQNPMKYLN